MKVVDRDWKVTVLRLGHRLVRDERMSTHVGLVARAFGAEGLILSGREDDTAESVEKMVKRWGGNFKISFSKSWRRAIEEWRNTTSGKVIHLTMYGEPIDIALDRIRSLDSTMQLLVLIGGEKVPAEAYSLADYNVAVGNQPHSEVAALAVFLDRLYRGKELYNMFDNPRMRIVPMSNHNSKRDPRRIMKKEVKFVS